jgi:hypothetical protein
VGGGGGGPPPGQSSGESELRNRALSLCTHPVTLHRSVKTYRHFLIQAHSATQVVVAVQLPGLSGAGDIDLDLTDNTLTLLVPGRYALSVALAGPLVEDEIGATWVKDRETLVVTVPRP